MGYSTSIRAFNRVKRYLDEMVSKNEQLVWEAPDAAKLAYYIREGIRIAKGRVSDSKTPKQNLDFFQPYSSLSAKYVVRVKDNNVVAEPRDLIPQLAASEVLRRMVIEEAENPLEIVGALIKHKAPEMFFPNGDESPENLAKIYAWSSKNDYFIVASDVGVTLTKTDPGEIAWRPVESS